MIIEIGGLLLLVLVSMALLWPLGTAALRQRRLHAWPQVTGFVTAHRLRQTQNAYYPEHQVRFQLAGRESQTWCGSPDRAGITGHGTANSRPRPDIAAQKVVDRHPVGTTIAVRVNPENHTEAYRVERELPLTLIAVLASAALLGFIFAVIWVLFLP